MHDMWNVQDIGKRLTCNQKEIRQNILFVTSGKNGRTPRIVAEHRLCRILSILVKGAYTSERSFSNRVTTVRKGKKCISSLNYILAMPPIVTYSHSGHMERSNAKLS